jgi:hypothetical protein
MDKLEQQRRIRQRLASVLHADVVTSNVAATRRYNGESMRSSGSTHVPGWPLLPRSSSLRWWPEGPISPRVDSSRPPLGQRNRAGGEEDDRTT